MEIRNNGGWPCLYSCNFIEDGIVSYKDSDGGIAYLPNETIKKMAASFVGKPVCINHQKITPQNYEDLRKKGVIVGNVTRVWFNSQDGWWWCDFIVDTEEGRKRIDEKKDKVSCAYIVIDTKEGGLWHDIPYDAEITDGEYTHLALVENPRYEDARITKQLPEILVNEKAALFINNKEDEMFKFFKNLKDGKKEEIDPIVNFNGKDYPLGEVLEGLMDAKNGKGEMEGVHAKDNMLIDINGHSYKINDLKNALKNWKPENAKNCKCNAKDGEEHKEGCDMYQNKNEKSEEEKEKEKKEKESLNAKDLKDRAELAEKKRLEEVENARKEKEKLGVAFFNSLETMSQLATVDNSAQQGQPLPRSRQERANIKKAKIDAQFAGSK